MTKEEAIEELKEDIALYMPIEQGEEIDRDTPDGRLITALEMAIKALEQTETEKCGDCISREQARELMYSKQDALTEYDLDSLPSVEPERKTGKWEYVQYDGNPKIGNWHCSNCRLIVNLGFEGSPYYYYCPGCGADMRGGEKDG